MKIECKIKRAGGSRVTLGGKEYRFEPDANGRHVADVDDADHAARLLDISAYRQVDGDAEAPVASEGYQGDSEGEEREETDLDHLDDEGLARVYEEVLGKKPHHNAKRETLIRQIEERAAEQ